MEEPQVSDVVRKHVETIGLEKRPISLTDERIEAHLRNPGRSGTVFHSIKMDIAWDSVCCTTCDVWLEPKCSCGPEDDCPFPGTRPARPSESSGSKEPIGRDVTFHAEES